MVFKYEFILLNYRTIIINYNKSKFIILYCDLSLILFMFGITYIQI